MQCPVPEKEESHAAVQAGKQLGERDLYAFVDSRQNMSRQQILAAGKASSILRFVNRSEAYRLRDYNHSLFSTLDHT